MWAGLHAWLEFCFELAVDQGLPPEEIIMVLYASTENAEVFSLMARYGIYRQMRYHSTTSQYGTMTRAKELLNDEIREKARSFLVDDIMGGSRSSRSSPTGTSRRRGGWSRCGPRRSSTR